MITYPSVVLEKNPAIIFIHGWKGSGESNLPYVNALTQKGYICINFDLPGHGKNEMDVTQLTREDFLNYIISVYDSLLAIPEVDTGNISVAGSSFGAYLALLLSSKRNVSKLALRVPANYPDTGFNEPQILFSGENEEIIEWRKKELSKNDSRSLHALHMFEGNTLIVESGLDKLIPHQTIENYINVIKNKNLLTYNIMKDATHSLKNSPYKIDFIKILTAWF